MFVLFLHIEVRKRFLPEFTLSLVEGVEMTERAVPVIWSSAMRRESLSPTRDGKEDLTSLYARLFTGMGGH
jgi:hypothetical protein